MNEKILISLWLVFFAIGMGLHARLIWIIKSKFPQLYNELDTPTFFTAHNFKAQKFIAKQAFAPESEYEHIFTLCKTLFWIQTAYIALFICVVLKVL